MFAPTQTHRFKAAVVGAGLSGEGHGFDQQKDLRDVLERALRWFGKYLGTGAEVRTASSR